ncbi:Bystin [Geodia barretti]|uniref:Bystin n=1 Tax=Geodia barretti TaxID=519541 RepID=A0AA35RY56_GEOBA|nr:Bystin [Geodia barretti]
MGKVKKARLHQALADQILEGDAPRPRSRSGKARQRATGQPDDQSDFVEERLTQRILRQARQQQEELEEEFGSAPGGTGRSSGPWKRKKRNSLSGSKVVSLDTSGERGSDAEEDASGESEFGDEEQSYGDEDCCPRVTEEDEEAMRVFMHEEATPRRTLADIILEKIREKETEIASQVSDVSLSCTMDEKVVTVFKGVGQILAKYRSGKLPKAFKVIPSLGNWEEVLYLTEPTKWSAAAMFQATRIFASNLSTQKAQYFFNLVLLPRVRDDISEYKQLNFHLYMALKKALFKPAAFFKGILLPLCESGTCTLREALIISSVLAKCSIPMLHSSAALLKIAEMEYSGTNSIFIRTLLDKKYALPYRAIDAVVFHFLRFKTDDRTLPVLWHQALLTFVQRYKEDMSVEQKEGILELVRGGHTHHEIGPEVRREIVGSKCRDLGAVFSERLKGTVGTTPMQE